MDDLIKEFDLLLMDYEDGTISDKDLEKLRSMLKEHEELRKIYIRHQMIEATINNSDLKQISIADLKHDRKQNVDMRFSTFKIAAVAALLAIAVIILFLQGPTKDAVLLGHLEGEIRDVTVLRNGVELDAEELIEINEGDILQTAETGALFKYSNEDTLIVLGHHSRVKVLNEKGAKRIHLIKGDIICEVSKQPAGKPLIIYTTNAATTVLGTRFMLSSGEETRLEVIEGSVRLEDIKTKEAVEAKAGWVAKIATGTGVTMQKLNSDKNPLIIDRLVLIDSDKEIPVKGFENLQNKDVISLSESGVGNFNILVDVDKEKVGGVLFHFTGRDLKGRSVRIFNTERNQNRNKGNETIYPYHIIGDGGDYWPDAKPLSWKAVPGKYVLSVTPFGKSKSQLGKMMKIQFEITE